MRDAASGTILADPEPKASGPMIDSLTIKNFKCFENISLDDLGRINVVVGDNGVGKTALLEAIYLVSGNTPENHMKLGSWRGARDRAMVAISEEEVASGDVWRDLFRGFDLDNRITIAAKGGKSLDRTLVISRQKTSSGIMLEGHVVQAGVAWEWLGGTGRSAKGHKSVPFLNSQSKTIEFPAVPSGEKGAFLAGGVKASELAQRYSDLDKRNRANPMVAAISQEFPDIEGLSIQTDLTVGHMLYASLKSLDQKVPLAYVSSGINWFIHILVTMASFPNGTVSIDEIDTGVFHTRLWRVWRAVDALSAAANTQVFASTHSAEALTAMAPMLEDSEGDVRLIRVSRDERGRSNADVYGGRNLSAAIAEHVEVR